MAQVPDLKDLISLRGRRAVVTGGAKGIGEAVCCRLAEAHADVVVADLDFDRAVLVAKEIEGWYGTRAVAARIDVADTASLVAAAEIAVSQLGGLDIWVNNAGIYPSTGPAIDAADEFFDRLLTINVRGTFAGAREAARRMTRGGVIVNLASTFSFEGGVWVSAYSTSKHAAIGLIKNLAIEFGPLGIRVLGVAPSAIDTDGFKDKVAEMEEAGVDVHALLAGNPLGLVGHADDVARVVLFCASDMAAFMTGSTLVVDGGSLLSKQ